jgi:hypothetical protein
MDVTSKSAASSSTNKIVSSNLTPYTLETYHQRPPYPTLYQPSSVTAIGDEILASVTLRFYTDSTLDNVISWEVCAWPRA